MAHSFIQTLAKIIFSCPRLFHLYQLVSGLEFVFRSVATCAKWPHGTFTSELNEKPPLQIPPSNGMDMQKAASRNNTGTLRAPRKRALLIGIQQIRAEMDSEPSQNDFLKGPHQDVDAMRRLLEDIYGYSPEDIITLIDNDEVGDIQPTRENIILQIGNLLNDARENDRFLFHFSGHSDQVDTDGLEEEDGKDEFIYTSDNKRIIDNELRQLLVDPLPASCSLTAIFDSCHSCTMLDLPHFRCNRVYVPWINRVVRQTYMRESLQWKCEGIASKRNSPMYCSGFCRTKATKLWGESNDPKPNVICLSASKDDQLTWEKDGKTMTQILVNMLRENTDRTLEELLTQISHTIHTRYLSLHEESEKFMIKWNKYNRRRLIESGEKAQILPIPHVEMHNFQSPQFSSFHPLDMKSLFQP